MAELAAAQDEVRGPAPAPDTHGAMLQAAHGTTSAVPLDTAERWVTLTDRLRRSIAALESDRVVHIVIDPARGPQECSICYVVTASGRMWSRVCAAGSTWEPVTLPPGCTVDEPPHARHLKEFHDRVAAVLDAKLVQDLYDAAEEAALTPREG